MGSHDAAPALAVALLSLLAGAASGQSYPEKPIRIVTTVPGGSLDLTARVLAPRLTERLGKQVIVDNRGGILSMELVAKAPADGYSLLLASASLWTSQFLRNDVPWDPVKDYAPISLLVTSPNILIVHPSLPVRSVKELIALAKSQPGAINYASGQSGSSAHVAAELFKALAGVDMVRVAYKGQGPAMVSLVTGETQVSFPNAASATPFIKSGRARALAVTTAKPSVLAPGLPTLAAAGLPGYESKAVLGLFAPAKTPAAIVSRLNTEVVRVLNEPEVKQRFLASGAETVGSTPEELAAEIASDIATTGKLLRNIGVTAK
jgi:tripartite-type tricarboxylate transporter receptor subunit TctC